MEKTYKIYLAETENRAGTDFPYYYDERTGEEYEGSWNMSDCYPFGYWPCNWQGETKFYVAEQGETHKEACLLAVQDYLADVVEDELHEDTSIVQDLLDELQGMIDSQEIVYNENSGEWEEDGEEFDLDEFCHQAYDNGLRLSSSYERLLYIARGLLEDGYKISEYDISQELEEEWKSTCDYDYDGFVTYEGASRGLDDLCGISFDSFFQDGYLQGRIFFDSEILGFYFTPSPDDLDSVLGELSHVFSTISYNELLNYHIIYEDNNDGYEVKCMTCRDFINGTNEEDSDNEEEEPQNYERKGRQFIPHLASPEEKREYFKNWRQNRDQVKYAPITRALGSVARYNWLRHPYGESIDRINKTISEANIINQNINTMKNNKQIIRLTEDDVRGLIKEAIYRTFNTLSEGIYPNGQQDMFMGQDELDSYVENADTQMMHALYDAEKKCKWAHAKDEQVSPNVVKFYCYPENKMACEPNEFIQAVTERFPFPKNIECRLTRRGGVNVYMNHYDGPRG